MILLIYVLECLLTIFLISLLNLLNKINIKRNKYNFKLINTQLYSILEGKKKLIAPPLFTLPRKWLNGGKRCINTIGFEARRAKLSVYSFNMINTITFKKNKKIKKKRKKNVSLCISHGYLTLSLLNDFNELIKQFKSFTNNQG